MDNVWLVLALLVGVVPVVGGLIMGLLGPDDEAWPKWGRK